jgi:hypothetical protein
MEHENVDQTVSTTPTPIQYPIPNPIAKQKRMALIVIGIVILLLMVSGGAYYFLNNKSPVITQVSRRVAPSTFPSVNPSISAPITNSAVLTSPDGKKVLFAIFEGLKLNVYSIHIDGTEKKLLISHKIDETSTRARPASILFANMSPDGRFLAYKFPPAVNYTSLYPSTLTLIDTVNQTDRKVAENVTQFVWSPDSHQLLYMKESPQKESSNFSEMEAPLYNGSSWYLDDIQQSTERKIEIKDNIFSSTSGFIDNDHVLFVATSAYGGVPAKLFVYDLRNNESTSVTIEGEQISSAVGNSNQDKAIVSVLPQNYGIDYACDLYEINLHGEIINDLVKSPNYQCGFITWNGNDEIFYEKGTGPDGKIDTSKSDESGYYILSSVYKYNFNNKKEELVLKNTGKEIFKLMGILEGKIMVVSNESAKRTPNYILETRNLDGSNPKSLVTSTKEILFIGFSM